MNTFARILFFVCIGIGFVRAQSSDPDMLFTSPHLWYNGRSAALGGSGAAVVDDISSASINPALPNAFALAYGLKSLMVTAGYGKGDLFAEHIVPVSVGWCSPVGTVGVVGRYLKAPAAKSEYEGIFVYSCRLFEKSMGQGAVDLGINVRFDRQNWQTAGFDTLFTIKTMLRPNLPLDTIARTSYDKGHLLEDRLAFDVGCYQSHFADALDFGIVMHNAFGYRWSQEAPTAQVSIVKDTLTADSSIVVQNEYTAQVTESKDFLPGWYRGITAGFAYNASLMDDRVGLMIPLDIEVLGIFDRSRPMLFMLRCGMEMRISDSYILRVGYARQPLDITRSAEKPVIENQFFAGAGLRVSGIALDFYFGRNQWGLSTGVNY